MQLSFPITYSLLGSVFQNYVSQPSITPDDDVFKHLSLTYANNHAKMSRGVACKSATPTFEQGITNGAAWYPLTGGMQVIKIRLKYFFVVVDAYSMQIFSGF